MSRLFGWDLPPGVSQRDIDNAYGQDGDPTPESEHVWGIFDEVHSGATPADKAEVAICEYVDNLALRLAEAEGLLRSASRLLPLRGPEPKCTCKTAEYGWCDLHSSDWYEPTVKEEIEQYLGRPKK